jgi:hypothetical protein
MHRHHFFLLATIDLLGIFVCDKKLRTLSPPSPLSSTDTSGNLDPRLREPPKTSYISSPAPPFFSSTNLRP